MSPLSLAGGAGHDSSGGLAGLAGCGDSWLGWVGDGDGDNVAPDVSVGDGLAVVALRWWVVAATLRWGWSATVAGIDGLDDGDGRSASDRAVCRWCRSGRSGSWLWRLRRRCWVRVNWGDDWVARSCGPDLGGQVC